MLIMSIVYPNPPGPGARDKDIDTRDITTTVIIITNEERASGREITTVKRISTGEHYIGVHVHSIGCGVAVPDVFIPTLRGEGRGTRSMTQLHKSGQ